MKSTKAFSLVELMISLIVISCIMAAFVPVISKKMKYSAIALSAGGVSEITTDCSEKFSSNCKLCTKQYCIQCELSNCAAGTYTENKSCSCKNCAELFPNCSECDSQKCTKCKDNNYSINNGRCEICPSGKICDGINAYDESYCANPPFGYYCEGNVIKSCKEKYSVYCATCNASSCLSCDRGYYLTNGTCKRCTHAGCTSCINGSYCLACNITWVHDPVNHTCSKTCAAAMPKCIYCSSATKCTKCTGGYYVNSSGSCSACSVISNCVYCNSSTKCEQCKSGYYVNPSGKCSSCTVANCAQCSSDGLCETCAPGYYLSDDKKSCISNDSEFNCSDSNFMKVGNLCVTRKNMGDSPTLSIPSTINIAQAPSEYCYSQTNKCCWNGTTSVKCNSSNGGYSGCTRTVCTYNAAQEICSKFNYAGKTWRLPTTSEMTNWINYSRGLGANGLMLCDETANSELNAHCDYASTECLGSYNNLCFAKLVISQGCKAYDLFSSAWRYSDQNSYQPFSVRCVTEME